MKHRITALALALGLSVSLTACGSQTDPAPGDSLAPSPDITQTVTQAPAPSDAALASEPDVTPIPDKGTPPPDSDISPEPAQGAAVDEPTAVPTPTAGPEPSDVASIGVLAASTVYKAVAKSAGATAATMDASSVMENFYNLSAADLEDYVFYMPELSANIEEIFIAHAKEGKVDAVKTACQSRLGGLKEDAEFYPATGAYVSDAKLVTEGNWVLFCVCPDSAGAVKAFQDCLK